MPRISDFQTVEPTTNELYPFDFTSYVPSGATLSSATVTLSVYLTIPGYTADATPATRLSGSATVAGSIAKQRITGLVDGNDYLATCTGMMSDGSVIVLWGVIPCRAPGDV